MKPTAILRGKKPKSARKIGIKCLFVNLADEISINFTALLRSQ